MATQIAAQTKYSDPNAYHEISTPEPDPNADRAELVPTARGKRLDSKKAAPMRGRRVAPMA
eukprot:scaffold345825_cov35-Prasinocladus_malaysianus.AAC.1